MPPEDPTPTDDDPHPKKPDWKPPAWAKPYQKDKSAPVMLVYAALREARYGVGDTRAPMRASLAANAVNIVLDLLFRFPRPRSHFGTGRNAGQLKPSAPFYVRTRPDLDKLARAVGDALRISTSATPGITCGGRMVTSSRYGPALPS